MNFARLLSLDLLQGTFGYLQVVNPEVFAELTQAKLDPSSPGEHRPNGFSTHLLGFTLCLPAGEGAVQAHKWEGMHSEPAMPSWLGSPPVDL